MSNALFSSGDISNLKDPKSSFFQLQQQGGRGGDDGGGARDVHDHRYLTKHITVHEGAQQHIISMSRHFITHYHILCLRQQGMSHCLNTPPLHSVSSDMSENRSMYLRREGALKPINIFTVSSHARWLRRKSRRAPMVICSAVTSVRHTAVARRLLPNSVAQPNISRGPFTHSSTCFA